MKIKNTKFVYNLEDPDKGLKDDLETALHWLQSWGWPEFREHWFAHLNQNENYELKWRKFFEKIECDSGVQFFKANKIKNYAYNFNGLAKKVKKN